jgi:hypothetical protein
VAGGPDRSVYALGLPPLDGADKHGALGKGETLELPDRPARQRNRGTGPGPRAG